jgi:hypothetical protein
MLELRRSLDMQLVLTDTPDEFLKITQPEAELMVGLIDTVLRWDYEIEF